MDIKTGVYTYLSNIPFAYKVYPGSAPQDHPNPYVTYQITERKGVFNQDGSASSGLQECVIQFDAWGFTALDTTTVCEALITELNGQQNTTFGSVLIRSLKLNNNIETEEPLPDASENYLYRSMVDFHCWFIEA